MVRIDFALAGYRKISPAPEDVSLALGILLRSGISARVSSDGEILIKERDFSTCKRLFDSRIVYKASDKLGLPGLIGGVKYKSAVIIGFVLSLLLVLSSRMVVWEVRVEGNVSVPDSVISAGLESAGLSVGSFWGELNFSEIETAFVKAEKRIAWLNINRRGTVAYITVKENENSEKPITEQKDGYSNLVASRDCVIEEIRVKSGVARVKVGDTVKKGDILISGVVDTEYGVKLCYAEGVVLGRVSEEITSNCTRTYIKKNRLGEKTLSCSVKIFNFSINIFKLYGNPAAECDIIKDVKTYSLFGAAKLPLEIYLESQPIYSECEEEYTDSELVSAASRLLDRRLAEVLTRADLVAMSTVGEFTDDGYVMKCRAVYLCQVGEDAPFTVQ